MVGVMPPGGMQMQGFVHPGTHSEHGAFHNGRADSISPVRGRGIDQSGDRSVSASPVRVVKGGDEEDEFIVHPRRKAGQPKASGCKGKIVLTHGILEKYFDLPLVTAAEKLVGHRDCSA